eukprot:302603-Pleurochrysis_carterae.AAC.4
MQAPGTNMQARAITFESADKRECSHMLQAVNGGGKRNAAYQQRGKHPPRDRAQRRDGDLPQRRPAIVPPARSEEGADAA